MHLELPRLLLFAMSELRTVLALAFIAIAYFLYGGKYDLKGAESPEAAVYEAWSKQIQAPPKIYRRFAVGLNANADLIVSGTGLLRSLRVEPSNRGRDHSVLNSLEQLEEAFSFFFEKGAASERYFANSEVYAQLVQVADQQPNKQYNVGGNAALMGQKIAELDESNEVLLVGCVGPTLQALLNASGVLIPGPSLRDRDQVHLIMEYPVGEGWGGATAPVANRFITSNDQTNAQMQLLETFSSSIAEFGAEVVVLSGLHLMEGQSRAFWSQRVAEVAAELRRIPPGVPIHLELASMANHQLLAAIIQQVFPVVHSVGLNEQELAFISQVGGSPHRSLAGLDGDGDQPEIAVVNDLLHWMLTTYGAGAGLSRVHFHSLTFHVVATLSGSWLNSASAVAAGTRTSSLQACGAGLEGGLDPGKHRLRIPQAFALSVNSPQLRRRVVIFDPSQPVTLWRREGVELAFSPVLVCNRPGRTVGLGDAISATGLLYSRAAA